MCSFTVEPFWPSGLSRAPIKCSRHLTSSGCLAPWMAVIAWMSTPFPRWQWQHQGLIQLNCLFFFGGGVTLVRSFSCPWSQLKLIRKVGKHIYTIIKIPQLAAEFCQLDTDLDRSGKREVLFLFVCVCGGGIESGSHYISLAVCPETHYEDQAGLEVTEISLLLPPNCWN